MVKKLSNSDIEAINTFMYADPDFNLFLIGDVENHGVETDFIDVWGAFTSQGLTGVLLRYYRNFLVFGTNEPIVMKAYADIITNHPAGYQSIAGEASVIEATIPLFDCPKVEETFFCRLKEGEVFDSENVEDIKTALPEDAGKLCALLGTIEEFGPFNEKQIAHALETQSGRAYYIENDSGQIISMAQVTAENSVSAMIIGVCTHKDYRKQGLMHRVMTKLCADMTARGKKLYLFYSNQEAGRIYHSMGFETIGNWTMMKFE